MLTHIQITNAKPRDKPYKLSDGAGLSLIVQPNGKKMWRFRYRFGGKENMLALGSHPEVSAGEAREKRDEARKLLAKGIDPSQQRKADKRAAVESAQNTFGALATEFLERQRHRGLAEVTLEKNRWMLEDLAASLTDRPIADIKPADVLEVLRKVEQSGRRDTARKMRGTVGAVFRYAIQTLRAENDPTFALRGALLAPQTQHRAAITDEKKLGALKGAALAVHTVNLHFLKHLKPSKSTYALSTALFLSTRIRS
jgi:hypothetical protein